MEAELRMFVAGQWVQLGDSSIAGSTDQVLDAAFSPKPYFYNLVSGRATSRLPGGAEISDIRSLAEHESPKEHVMPSKSQVMGGKINGIERNGIISPRTRQSELL